MRAWDWYGDASVVLTDIPLACCGLEIEAALPTTAHEVAWDQPAGHRIVTVSGTITRPLAADVAALVDELRTAGDVTVVAFGACTGAGGPYWDSYAITPGLAEITAVDVFVPGCPPTPAALAGVVEQVRVGAHA